MFACLQDSVLIPLSAHAHSKDAGSIVSGMP